MKICNFVIFDLQSIENQTADCNILNVAKRRRHHTLNENRREYKENVMWPLKDILVGSRTQTLLSEKLLSSLDCLIKTLWDEASM